MAIPPRRLVVRHGRVVAWAISDVVQAEPLQENIHMSENNTYGPACPRCGAMLSTGGCMSCGYPSLRLDTKVGANTDDSVTESVKFPILMSALKLNATLTARLEEMRAAYETSRESRLHAEDCVKRLTAENAKLRKCVEAADTFFLTEDAMCTAAEEGTGNDLWLESQEHRYAYDAARAEVDK